MINVTDVGHLTSDADTGEDKMEKAVEKEGKSAKEIADFWGVENIFADLHLLGSDAAIKGMEKIFDDMGNALGIMLANVVNTLDPQAVCLSGAFGAHPCRHAPHGHTEIGGERIRFYSR